MRGCLIIAREDLRLQHLLGMSIGLSCKIRPAHWQVMAQSLNGRNLCNRTDVTYAAAGESLVHCARSGTLGDQPVPIGIGKRSRACLSVLDRSSRWALVPLLSVQSDHSPPVCHQAGDLYIGFFLISFPVVGYVNVLMRHVSPQHPVINIVAKHAH